MRRQHNYRYVSEEAKAELKELLDGDHGEAIKAWGHECANAAYRKGVIYGVGAVVVAQVISGLVKKARIYRFDKHVERRVHRVVKDVTIK